MANGTDNRMSFQDYKQLTEEERQFYLYDKLCNFDDLEEKFAAKWVEKGIVGAIVLVLTSIGGGIMWLLGIHGSNTTP
jgi:hypothetical protein